MLLKSLSKLAKLLKLTSVLMKSEQSVKGKKYILFGQSDIDNIGEKVLSPGKTTPWLIRERYVAGTTSGDPLGDTHECFAREISPLVTHKGRW